jgi:hypothetical protein
LKILSKSEKYSTLIFQIAASSRTTRWNSLGAPGTAMVNTLSGKNQLPNTQIMSINTATRQRIANAALADFVAPFDLGRYGSCVAPNGRNFYFPRSDTSKGNSQGNLYIRRLPGDISIHRVYSAGFTPQAAVDYPLNPNRYLSTICLGFASAMRPDQSRKSIQPFQTESKQ